MIPVLIILAFFILVIVLTLAAIWKQANELLKEAEEQDLEIAATRDELHWYRKTAASLWWRARKFEQLTALRGNRLDEAQAIAAKIEKLAEDALVAHLDPEGDVKATIQAGKDATPA